MYLYKYNYSILYQWKNENVKWGLKKGSQPVIRNKERIRNYPDKLFVPINVFESITP